MDEIVNKVAQSGLLTIDLQDIRPGGQRSFIDIKDQLWQEIALKEKDFRGWIKENDWSTFGGHHVAVGCSVDAVIPSWAYMLVASSLGEVAQTIVYGGPSDLENALFETAIGKMDVEPFRDERVIIKGCGEGVPQSAYLYLTKRLKPIVKSMMFGEPCSTVPVYKAPKK